MATTIQTIEVPKKARALDTSGNNNHGQIYSGRGLEFDGIADNLTTGSDIEGVNKFSDGTAWTVTCWVYFTEAANSYYIGDDGGSYSMLAFQSGQYLRFREVTGGAFHNFNGTNTINLNTWYRQTVVCNGTTITCYLNGEIWGSAITPDSTLMYFTGIGNPYESGGTRASALSGMMSDFQAWDAAFTQADVTYDYLNPESLALNNGGTALTESNLKLWYPMQDGHRGQQSYILDGANSGLGDDLVTNGDFDTDSDWDINIGTTEISGGTASFPDSTSSFLIQNFVVDLTIKTYKLSYEVVTTNGSNFRLAGGNSAFGLLTLDSATVGVKTKYITSNGTKQNLQFNNNAFIGSIDNVSIKPVNDKNHATTVFTGDDLWDIADNNVSDWVATAATSVASSEVAIGGSTDGVKLIYGSQNSNHSSYAQLTASKFLSENLTVGRKYTVSGLFATDVVGNTNAPGVAVYASGWNYPTGFASAAANLIPATNLIINGTMEANDNWNVYSAGTVSQSTTQKHNGSNSFKFIVANGGASDGTQSDTFTVTADTTYLLSAWVYPDDTTTITIKILEGNGSTTQTKNIEGLTENTWNKVERQFVNGEAGSGAAIRFTNTGTNNSGTDDTYYIDDVVYTAFLEREITFTATSTTGDYLAAKNVDHSTTNDLISQVNDRNSIFDESSINSSSGWQSYVGGGGTSVVSYDATEDEVTFTTTTNTAIEGMKLEDENYTALEIGRTYTVLITMRAASGTPTVKVRLGLSSIVTDAITTSDVVYNFSVTPVNITSSLLVYLQDTTGIDITVSKVEIFPNCNLYVDDLSFKEIGVASGWTDADQQLHIPQTALQSYNELAWSHGSGDVSMGTLAADFGTNDFTISYVIHPDIQISETRFFQLGETGGTGWVLHKITADGTLKLYVKDSDATTLNFGTASTSTALSGGKTYHIVESFDRSAQTVTIYINGVSNTVLDISSLSTAATISCDGTLNLFSYVETLRGFMTEIALWKNTDFDSTEVQELYNDGKPLDALLHTKASTLYGYWRNNGLSTWVNLANPGTKDSSSNTLTETILIPQGVDSTRDNQGFIMNRQKDTSCLNLTDEAYVDSSTGGFVGTSDFSVSCWFKTTDSNAWLLMKGEQGSGGKRYALYVHTSNYLTAEIDDNSTFVTWNGSATVNDGDWHHVVVVYDRSGNGQIYLDGSADGSATDISSSTGSLDPTSHRDFTVGVNSDDETSGPYTGQVDGVLVYTKALSLTEVERNYNATKGNHRN